MIVPVYNGSEFIGKCLDALFSSAYPRFDVIVVNDGSTDESVEIAFSKGARVIQTAGRSGPGAARNLAAGVAEGEILLFVDADVVVKPDTLQKVGTRFAERPEISALFGSYDDEPAEQNFLSQYKNLQHHFVHQTSSPDASTFWSGLGAMRRTVFLEHHGFDHKKFAEPSIEDIDLGSRLRQAGQRILLDPGIQAKHLKKWGIRSHLRTEIFCRALPWSRLIIEEEAMINDMNLRTADRLSAGFTALFFCSLPLWIIRREFILVTAVSLAMIAILNRKILGFFARKRGSIFALSAFPWQLLYFFYSGVVFSYCWVRYALPRTLGIRKGASLAR